ncbi:Hypothetical predicted protein, partial [Mytilus galloprovincialis]
ETENYIKVKPGIETDGYNVTIKIQIYDIFIDYTECTQHIGQVCSFELSRVLPNITWTGMSFRFTTRVYPQLIVQGNVIDLVQIVYQNLLLQVMFVALSR